jgi:hypothetical protein
MLFLFGGKIVKQHFFRKYLQKDLILLRFVRNRCRLKIFLAQAILSNSWSKFRESYLLAVALILGLTLMMKDYVDLDAEDDIDLDSERIQHIDQNLKSILT